MKRMLFNATQAEELRVAIVDGQKLIDLDIETFSNQHRKGNIYKGKITRIEPSLEACFVDYGAERHGFLPFKEVSRSYFQGYEGGRVRVQEVLKEGMEVLVQVEKDERGNKGAALTTFISLAGRFLVLMPNNPRGGGVSRRVEGEERIELKSLLAELEVPRGMSIIARTAGIGRTLEDLSWDLSYLLKLWQAISEANKQKGIQNLILQESSLVIRDYYQPDIGEVLIDTDEVYDKVYQFMSLVMPNNVNKVKKYVDRVPLFSRFQVEHQIESAYSRDVSLPSGGAIIIDHTEALVSIDVNSARATKGSDVEETATKTNIEAAEEIARQMRLRDLGGLVVIDFIDMENPKNQRLVEQTLKENLKLDRARIQVGKLSRFGLLELSRQRLQLSLGESSHIACPRCYGTGFIRSIESSALHIFRIILEEAMKDNTGEIHAQVPVEVATFLLNEKRAELFNIEEHLGVPILLIPNKHLETPHYDIQRIRLDEVNESFVPSYKRVTKPQNNEQIVHSSTKNKLNQNEAAVQGVKPSAYNGSDSKSSLLTRVSTWLKNIFSASEKSKEDDNKKTHTNKSRNNNNNRPYNNRTRNRRNNTTRTNHTHHKKPVSQSNKAKQIASENSGQKNKPLDQTVATVSASAEQVHNSINVDQNNNRNKTSQPQKNRQRRSSQQKTSNAEIIENKVDSVIVQNNQDKPIVVEQDKPLVINLSETVESSSAQQKTKEKKTTNRQRSNVRSARRRSSGKNYRIVAAEELIERIDINAITRRIRKLKKAIVTVQSDDLAIVSNQEENLLFEQVQETVAKIENNFQVQLPAVQEKIFQADEPIDLGDLVLVETQSQSTISEVITESVEIKGLRRSDIIQKKVEIEENNVLLEQVETNKGL